MRISRRLLENLIRETCCPACAAGGPCDAIGDEPPHEALLSALAAMRLAYLCHQQAHWESRGDAYYGDHLLYQRLYEEIQGSTDELAERIAGLMGWQTLSMHGQMEEILEDPRSLEILQTADHWERSLMAEEHALHCLEEAYRICKAADDMSLGLDDLLMGLCSEREQSLYLLQQRGER
jgi:DNA-binding ferritin-like protein